MLVFHCFAKSAIAVLKSLWLFGGIFNAFCATCFIQVSAHSAVRKHVIGDMDSPEIAFGQIVKAERHVLGDRRNGKPAAGCELLSVLGSDKSELAVLLWLSLSFSFQVQRGGARASEVASRLSINRRLSVTASLSVNRQVHRHGRVERTF